MDHATASSFLGISGVVWFWAITVIGVGAVAGGVIANELSDENDVATALGAAIGAAMGVDAGCSLYCGSSSSSHVCKTSA